MCATNPNTGDCASPRYRLEQVPLIIDANVAIPATSNFFQRLRRKFRRGNCGLEGAGEARAGFGHTGGRVAITFTGISLPTDFASQGNQRFVAIGNNLSYAIGTGYFRRIRSPGHFLSANRY